ncbi:unnamed protein product [Lactuca saligna]|uniref:Uncharacterized protein n=1 Tax=Lactuca saligna TaxID=75948 RepID=A0AA35VTP1_LACSI|nr:unnamed protein product [Lactuca saligna]
MFEDKVSLLRYALQRAFQAAPNRLMTNNAYLALLGASLNASTTDEGLNFYDSQHRFEHSQLLLVLLSSLPRVPKTFQCRILQDLLILACSHAVSIYTLVPGDRLDPGEKLVIGCRKATISAKTQDAKSDRLKKLLKETEKYLQKFGSAEPLKQIMVSDILFTWTDLQAKLNTELLNNLGNFVNHVLSFIAKDPGSFRALLSYLFYLKVIKEVVEVQDTIPSFWMLHLLSITLGDKIGAYVEQYVETHLYQVTLLHL